MATTIDAAKAETKARELLDHRIDAVRELVKSRQRLADLEAEVEQARKDDYKTYRAALRDGWSVDELKKLGLEDPSRKRAKRKTPRTPAADSASAEQGAATPEGATATPD